MIYEIVVLLRVTSKKWRLEWCYGSPHPRTTMDVTERHQFRGPIRGSVLDLVEVLVWTVDWLFFDLLEHPCLPFFLPQSSIPTLALGLCSHMDTIRVDHIPNVGILGVFGLGLL
jgi:hypothetical protein